MTATSASVEALLNAAKGARKGPADKAAALKASKAAGAMFGKALAATQDSGSGDEAVTVAHTKSEKKIAGGAKTVKAAAAPAKVEAGKPAPAEDATAGNVFAAPVEQTAPNKTARKISGVTASVAASVTPEAKPRANTAATPATPKTGLKDAAPESAPEGAEVAAAAAQPKKAAAAAKNAAIANTADKSTEQAARTAKPEAAAPAFEVSDTQTKQEPKKASPKPDAKAATEAVSLSDTPRPAARAETASLARADASASAQQTQQQIQAQAAKPDPAALKTDNGPPLTTGLPRAIEASANTQPAAPTLAHAAPHAAEVIRQIATVMARKAGDGASSFDIRLDPPELGRIDVKLDVSADGRVQAHLVVEKSETLDLMQRDQRALMRALEQEGLDVGADGLSFSLQDGDASGREANSEAAESAGRLKNTAAEIAEKAAAAAYEIAPRGLVDVRI